MAEITLEIELLTGIIFFLIIILWAIWFRLTAWMHKRKYKKYDDKSKNKEFEEYREELARRKPTTSEYSKVSSRPDQSGEERRTLQTTSVDELGKNSKSTRGFFGTRRRRKRRRS